jgi:RNA polymerase sigma-70 factor, ECF subfamily
LAGGRADRQLGLSDPVSSAPSRTSVEVTMDVPDRLSAQFEANSPRLRALDPDAVLRPDAAAVRMGALGEARGASAVAELMRGGARAARLALVGGVVGLARMPGGRIRGAVEFTIVDERIVAIDLIGDPKRLAQLDVVPLEN